MSVLHRFFYLGLLFAFLGDQGVGLAADLPDTVARLKVSVVGVGTIQRTRRPPEKFLGTGFVVSNGRYVLTNEHVVSEPLDRENKEQLAVFVGVQAQVRSVKLVAEDFQHDLALLKISGEPLPALTLGDSTKVREGESIAFTGFPIGPVLGLHPVTHQGIVSAITPIAIPLPASKDLNARIINRLNHPFNVFQLDAVAYPGNSGSPLYNPSSGAVVGIVNAVFVKQSKEAILQKPSGISYAIPIDYAYALLRKVGD